MEKSGNIVSTLITTAAKLGLQAFQIGSDMFNQAVSNGMFSQLISAIGGGIKSAAQLVLGTNSAQTFGKLVDQGSKTVLSILSSDSVKKVAELIKSAGSRLIPVLESSSISLFPGKIGERVANILGQFNITGVLDIVANLNNKIAARLQTIGIGDGKTLINTDAIKQFADFLTSRFNSIQGRVESYKAQLNELGIDQLVTTKLEEAESKMGQYYEQFKDKYGILSQFLSNVTTRAEAADQDQEQYDGTTSIFGNRAEIKGYNVIDTSKPVAKGKGYNLTEKQLAYLAYVAMKEQGSVEGAKVELSLMANQYEKSGSSKSVDNYIRYCGWYAKGSTTGEYYPGDAYVEVARDVFNNGDRYVASDVVEHDCISDIVSISTGSKNNRNNYIPGETIITNKFGSTYVFDGFAPNNGDPFGHFQ